MISRFLARAFLLLLVAYPCLLTAQSSLVPKQLLVDQYGEVEPIPLGGKYALAYEIYLTNLNPFPVRIEEVEVLSAGSRSPLLVLVGDQIDENVLRHLGLDPSDGDLPLLPGGKRAVLFLFLTFDHSSDIPVGLTHRIRSSREDDGGRQGTVVTETPPLEVSLQEPLLVIGSPVSQGDWFVGNCVDAGRFGHRGAIQSKKGTPVAPQRFALDLMKLADDGSLTSVPDPIHNYHFHSYGVRILAVADGTVVSVLDGVPENEPFSREMPIPMTRENMPGNHIVLDIGSQRFAFYAHLQPGSLLVAVGDSVTEGQPIALLGNSGRSDAPHLHFHIADSPDLLAADGKPFVFDAYEWLGERDLLEMINNSDAAWDPSASGPVRIREEMPLSNSVIRFRD